MYPWPEVGFELRCHSCLWWEGNSFLQNLNMGHRLHTYPWRRGRLRWCGFDHWTQSWITLFNIAIFRAMSGNKVKYEFLRVVYWVVACSLVWTKTVLLAGSSKNKAFSFPSSGSAYSGHVSLFTNKRPVLNFNLLMPTCFLSSLLRTCIDNLEYIPFANLTLVFLDFLAELS